MGPNNWATPQWLHDWISAEFFPTTLDVCAEPWSAKCPRYFTEADDGLAQAWTGDCWMNPPYTVNGTPVISQWVHAAERARHNGARVISILKNDPSTEWWSTMRRFASQVYTLEGARIPFDPPPGVAASTPSFTCVLAIFERTRISQRIGYIDIGDLVRANRDCRKKRVAPTTEVVGV